MAGACATGCYAQQGAYIWPGVAQAYEWRLEQTLSSTFVETMSAAIAVKAKTAARTRKQLVIRIHDSGDFYSSKYIQNWLKIIASFPDVIFYAYTKQVILFKRLTIPRNFSVIFSEGGLADDKIDLYQDRHARVFASEKELLDAGYVNASEDDLLAIGQSHKVGLIYHGHKSKTWTTHTRKAG